MHTALAGAVVTVGQGRTRMYAVSVLTMTPTEFQAMLDDAGIDFRAQRKQSARYLSRPEVAKKIGVKRETMARYRMPPADAFVGTLPGWLPSTIDAWQQARVRLHGARMPKSTW